MLDVECSLRGTAETYLGKVKAQHRHNPRLFDPKPVDARCFTIQHFAGRVLYDTSDFLGKIIETLIEDSVTL
jgi:Myosin heavy chain